MRIVKSCVVGGVVSLWLCCIIAPNVQAQDLPRVAQDSLSQPAERSYRSTIYGESSVEVRQPLPQAASADSIPSVQPAAGGARIDIDRARLPEAALQVVELVNVQGASLAEVLRATGLQYGVNIVVDESVQQVATLRLSDLSVIDFLVFLAEEYDLSLMQRGSVFRVSKPLPPPVVARPPPDPVVVFADSLLSVDFAGVPLERAMRALTGATGKNIVVSQGTSGTLTGTLTGVDFEEGLRILLGSNGFALRQRGAVYVVESAAPDASGTGGGPVFASVRDELISLDVTGASIADVLREIAAQKNLNLILYRVPEGQITARFDGLTVDEALGYLFRGLNVSYRKEGNLYVVGDVATTGILGSRLVRLGHMKAEDVPDLLPEALRQRASLRVVREQNGLIVTGPSDVIQEVEQFVAEIDHPSPQILIEALVVDYDKTDIYEFGLAVGRTGDPSSVPSGSKVTFGGTSGQGGVTFEADGTRTADLLNLFGGFAGVGVIGRLPDDFYLRIQALERDGHANVRSRPQIATLNGYPASISIGTTQYYLLKTTTPIPSGSQVIPIETERFEQIQANVSLEVTPYVSATGEVTAEIKPEFSTPVGAFDSNVPPTINTRVLQSTVRLRDGETIILGGLIQESKTVTYNKVPFLGSIPLLGRLFRSEGNTTRKSELVIYITPHVFYGDERDRERWESVRRRLRLTDPDEGRRLGYTELED